MTLSAAVFRGAYGQFPCFWPVWPQVWSAVMRRAPKSLITGGLSVYAPFLPLSVSSAGQKLGGSNRTVRRDLPSMAQSTELMRQSELRLKIIFEATATLSRN